MKSAIQTDACVDLRSRIADGNLHCFRHISATLGTSLDTDDSIFAFFLTGTTKFRRNQRKSSLIHTRLCAQEFIVLGGGLLPSMLLAGIFSARCNGNATVFSSKRGATGALAPLVVLKAA